MPRLLISYWNLITFKIEKNQTKHLKYGSTGTNNVGGSYLKADSFYEICFVVHSSIQSKYFSFEFSSSAA